MAIRFNGSTTTWPPFGCSPDLTESSNIPGLIMVVCGAGGQLQSGPWEVLWWRWVGLGNRSRRNLMELHFHDLMCPHIGGSNDDQ